MGIPKGELAGRLPELCDIVKLPIKTIAIMYSKMSSFRFICYYLRTVEVGLKMNATFA